MSLTAEEQEEFNLRNTGRIASFRREKLKTAVKKLLYDYEMTEDDLARAFHFQRHRPKGETKAKVKELFDKGLNDIQIADTLNLTKQAVNLHTSNWRRGVVDTMAGLGGVIPVE